MKTVTSTCRHAAPRLRKNGALAQFAIQHGPLGVLLAGVTLVYAPSLHDYFHGDDFLVFVDLTTKPAVDYLRDVFFLHDSDIYWRPLGAVYYYLVSRINGLDPVAFHVANLGIFLLTLVLLYAFCRREGFDRSVALIAVATLGFFPNHTSSVVWVTNGSRLVATMFCLASLYLLQRALRTRSRRFEALAVLVFLFGVLSDETSLALAPVAVLYGLVHERDTAGWQRHTLVRVLAYGAIALVVAGFIESVGVKAKAGIALVHPGWHMLGHYWALVAKLVFPINNGFNLAQITDGQWGSGALAVSIGLLLLVFGSNLMRFLVVWITLALLPFSMLTWPLVPARYVYMAAVPFAVVVARITVTGVLWLLEEVGRLHAVLVPVVAGAIGVVGLTILTFAVKTTAHRNASIGEDMARYCVLAEGLPRAMPIVPPYSRIVIYPSIWGYDQVGAEAIVRTVYRDRTLSVLNVSEHQLFPLLLPNDRIVYYTGKGFDVPQTPGSK